MTKPTKADLTAAQALGYDEDETLSIAQAIAKARDEEREACLMDIFGAIGPNDGGAIHIRNVRKVIRSRGGAA